VRVNKDKAMSTFQATLDLVKGGPGFMVTWWQVQPLYLIPPLGGAYWAFSRGYFGGGWMGAALAFLGISLLEYLYIMFSFIKGFAAG